MALTKDLSIDAISTITKNGIKLDESSTTYDIMDAYIKVNNFGGTKDRMDFTVGVYDVRGGSLLYAESYSFVPSVEDTAPNFIKQAYEYLKTLPPYTDAMDILEEGQS